MGRSQIRSGQADTLRSDAAARRVDSSERAGTEAGAERAGAERAGAERAERVSTEQAVAADSMVESGEQATDSTDQALHTLQSTGESSASGTHPAPLRQTTDPARTRQADRAETSAAANPAPIRQTTDPARTRQADCIQPDRPQTDTQPVSIEPRAADLPFRVYGTADTLRLRLADKAIFPANTDTIAERTTVSAEAVFGPRATLAAQQSPVRAEPRSLTDNAVFQGFVLLLAAAYALLLYHNLGDIRALLSRVSRETASGKRLFEDPAGSGFTRFLNTASAIGIFFLGVLAVKYGDALMPALLLEMLSEGAVLGLSLLSTAAFLTAILYQWAAVRIVGAVTLARTFTARLQLLRRTYFSLAVVIISPALLLFALCPRGTGEVWFLLIVIELTVTVFLYLREALNLFLSKKISILHWFLYLCAVEVFPISFLWLVAAR